MINISEDFNQNPRKIALNAFVLILQFLRELKKDKEKIKEVIPDYYSFEVGKYIPEIEFENLLLIFQKGNGGAKFSYREDDKFTITIFINNSFDWKNDLINHVDEWFKNHRSSFIHEFIHYLDIKNEKNLESMTGTDPNDPKSYYNNPFEIHAFLQQGLHELEWDLENKFFNRNLFVKQFGKDKKSFVDKVKRIYFPHEFLKHLSKDSLGKIEKALDDSYNQINFIHLEWLNVTTEKIISEIYKKCYNRD